MPAVCRVLLMRDQNIKLNMGSGVCPLVVCSLPTHGYHWASELSINRTGENSGAISLTTAQQLLSSLIMKNEKKIN